MRIALLLLFGQAIYCNAQDVIIDSLLHVLDVTISESGHYESQRVERISELQTWLSSPVLTNEARYELNKKLYDEYESYVCDSAWRYADLNIDLARSMNRSEWLHEATLQKAHILSTGGLFSESENLLRQIGANELENDSLRACYFKFLSDAYLYKAENNADNYFFHIYDAICRQYSDSALLYATEGSYIYVITQAPELAKSGLLKEATELLEASLVHYAPNTHEEAIIHSLMAFVCYCSNDSVGQFEHLVRSAIADIRSVVTENRALREVSEMLYAHGDLERANRYLKKSLADATKFNSRLRNLQSSKMLPVVDAAYQKLQEERQSEMRCYVRLISLLSVLLLVALVFIWRQMRSKMRANSMLSKLNADLLIMNNKLKESNEIKEEYVGRFMELCTTYISEFDAFRKKLHKASGQTKLSELQRLLSSDEQVDAIAKGFYRTFDSAFLNLFPDFVNQVNALFSPTDGIVLRSTDKLNTELRILSLIRLGITDSEKIASFLRCSITTIYTYRSKMKNRALIPDEFESQVMRIGTE